MTYYELIFYAFMIYAVVTAFFISLRSYRESKATIEKELK